MLIYPEIIGSKQKSKKLSIKNEDENRRNHGKNKRENNLGEVENKQTKKMWNHKAKVSEDNWILGTFLIHLSIVLFWIHSFLKKTNREVLYKNLD